MGPPRTWWREALRRLGYGLGLGLPMALVGLLLPVILLVGRRSYPDEVASASSCVLSSVTGGPRIATFSAWAWERKLRGKRNAEWMVAFVDALNGKGHSEAAWQSHRERGYL